jgi:hypothetical protein
MHLWRGVGPWDQPPLGRDAQNANSPLEK